MRQVVQVLVDYVLRDVYLHGPSMNGYGFWQGMPKSHICSTLTKTTEDFWFNNEIACDEIVEQHYESYRTLLVSMIVLYLYFMIVIRVPRILQYLCMTLYYCTQLACTRREQNRLRIISES